MDGENHQFIDILIENEQKNVISEYVVQVELSRNIKLFFNSAESVLIGFELLSRLIPSRNARVFWFFVAYSVCCRFISSRSGRVR